VSMGDEHAPDMVGDVMRSLRSLGVAPADARDAVARSAHVTAASLPERLRAALQALRVTYANRSAEPSTAWGARRERPPVSAAA
jgi:hypothetical protein